MLPPALEESPAFGAPPAPLSTPLLLTTLLLTTLLLTTLLLTTLLLTTLLLTTVPLTTRLHRGRLLFLCPLLPNIPAAPPSSRCATATGHPLPLTTEVY